MPVVFAGGDVVTLLAALVRERFGPTTDAELQADRRRVLAEATRIASPWRGRRQPRRLRLLLAHLEYEPRPWESREAWLGSMWDGRAA